MSALTAAARSPRASCCDAAPSVARNAVAFPADSAPPASSARTVVASAAMPSPGDCTTTVAVRVPAPPSSSRTVTVTVRVPAAAYPCDSANARPSSASGPAVPSP